MDDGAKLWLVKAARKNYWRVSAWYELDDVIQEGYYAYYFMVRQYPDVKDPRHRMALFKLVFHSVITNLANQRTRRVDEVRECELATDEAFGQSFMESLPAEADIAAAVAVLASAPQYVKDAVRLFDSAEGLRKLRHKYRRTGKGRRRRETLNERLCRLTGYDPATTDIVGWLRRALEGSDEAPVDQDVRTRDRSVGGVSPVAG